MENAIQTLGDNTKEAIKVYFGELLTNLVRSLALGIVNNSYYICLLICLISTLLYICGQKKAGKYATLSFVAYFLLQAIKGVIK